MGGLAALMGLSAGLAPLGMPALDPARPGWVATPPSYVRRATWQATLTATRARLLSRRDPAPGDDAGALWAKLDRDFPAPSDWMMQDAGVGRDAWFGATPPVGLLRDATRRACAELGPAGAPFRSRIDALEAGRAAADDARRLDLYVAACRARRARRLGLLLRKAPRIIFAKHFNMGGSHYAYTEGQSDAQNERHFYPGAALCRLDMQGAEGRVTTLVDDPNGVIRDPNVHWDGRKVAFAWKRSDLRDDYHLRDRRAGRQAAAAHAGTRLRRLRAHLPAQRRPRLQLHALRADGGLLVDRGGQPLQLRSGREPDPAAGV